MADDDGLRTADPRLFRAELATDERRHPQRPQKVLADCQRRDPRPDSARLEPSLTGAAIRRDGGEHALVLLDGTGLRDGGIASGVLPDQPGQPVGFGKRTGSQEHGIDDAEHRRVDANAKRHGQHRDGRKARTLSQHACGVAGVPVSNSF